MSKPTDFSAAFSLLKNHGVEFVVIGGVAARAHYSSYVTMDLDICYSRDKANLEKLAAALATIKATLRGAPPGLKFKLDARMLAAGLNFTLDTELGAIDVLGEVAGVGMYADALADAQLMPEFEVPVLSLKKLIASKKAAGRSKDLSLLLHLEYIAKAEQRLNSTPVAWPERVERLLALYKDKKIEQYQMVNYAYDAAAEIDSSEISHLMSMLPMEISAGLQDRVSNPTPSDDEFGCSADKLAQARERYLKVHNYFKQS